MTTQNSPLQFTLSDGRQVSVDQAKSVLQISERGIKRRCMVVRGSHGAAIYNASGDVQVNGAPSSSHWLKPGDRLEFSPTLTATVDQLGELEQAISQLQSPAPTFDSITPADFAASHAAEGVSRHESVLSFLENVQQAQPLPPTEAFKPATDATSEHLAPQQAFTPETPSAATEASQFTPEIEAIIAPPTPPTASEPSPYETALPAAAQPSLLTPHSTPEPAPVGPTPIPTVDPAPTNAQSSIGLAADLLRQIQEEENEATGLPTPTPTHSQVAGGASFSPEIAQRPPEPFQASVDDRLAPLEPSQVPPQSEPQYETHAAPADTFAPPVEQAIAPLPEVAAEQESAPAVNQPSESVAALLERMKSEGQWSGVPTDDEEPALPAQEAYQPEPQPEPAAEAPAAETNDCEDDVQSYMSQLLSRMRGGDATETSKPEAEVTTDDLPTVEQVVALEKAIKKLRPEEFVPKTKAKRVEGWQGMRELANSQVRNAIDKSQERKRKKSICAVQMAVGVASSGLAIYFWASSLFGGLSAPIAVACAICGGYAFYKSYVNVNVLAESKPKVVTTRPIQMQAPANTPPQQPRS